jgi:hypothetical protein
VGTDNFYSGMIDVGGEAGPAGTCNTGSWLVSWTRIARGWNWDFNRVQMLAPSVAYDFSTTAGLTVRFEFSATLTRSSAPPRSTPPGGWSRSFASNGPALPGMDRVTIATTPGSCTLVFTSRMNDEWSMRFNLMGGQGKKQFNNCILYGQAAATDYLFESVSGGLRMEKPVSWIARCPGAFPRSGPPGMTTTWWASVSLDHWDITYTIFDGTLIAHGQHPAGRIRVRPDWNALLYKFEYPTRYIPYNTEWLGGRWWRTGSGLMTGSCSCPPPCGGITTTGPVLRPLADAPEPESRRRLPRQSRAGHHLPEAHFPLRPGLQAAGSVAFYAGYTEAYLAVGAIYKADGSQLVPETGSNREIGLKVDLVKAFGGTFSGNLALFERRGAETSGAAIRTRGLLHPGRRADQHRGGAADHLYQREIFGADRGLTPGTVPRSGAPVCAPCSCPTSPPTFWLKYNLTRRLSIGGGYKHVGETISNNRLYLTEPFGTADLFASYTVPLRRGTVTYRVGVTNLADDPAIYRMDSAAAVYREDGRRAKATVSYAW